MRISGTIISFALLWAVVLGQQGDAEQLIDAYIAEYQHVHRTLNRTSNFDRLLEKVQASLTLSSPQPDKLQLDPRKFTFMCAGCQAVANTIINGRRSGWTEVAIGKFVLDQCVLLKIQPAEVCKGMIDFNLPILTFIIDHRPDFSAQIFCSLLLQYNECGSIGDYFEFSVKIDERNALPITGSKTASTASQKAPLKIVHITDIHYDPNYMVGANANCGMPTCCRESQGIATNYQEAAGFWGDYRDCDSSLEAIRDLFDHVKEEHSDADYVYFTGDVVDHGVWETSEEYIKKGYKTIMDLFVKTFPKTPVYFALGNHESHPLNLFAPSKIQTHGLTTQWLYDFVADQWSHWLPQATKKTIQVAGYYTVQMQPGLRLVVLNNNDCYTYNFWIYYDPQYLVGQLQWLHDTLLTAEAKKEKVHIIAHVPSGDDTCLKVWSREYRRILDRFWNTIVAQFNGHTHSDTFNVIYSRDSVDHAIGQAWNGGSFTTYSHLNRNYAVYEVDRESFEILEAKSYFYNLTEANSNAAVRPNWQQLYSLRKDFDLQDLSPATLNDLLTSFAKRPELLKAHWENTVRRSDKFLKDGCDKNCRKFHICDLAINEFGDRRKCSELLKIMKF